LPFPAQSFLFKLLVVFFQRCTRIWPARSRDLKAKPWFFVELQVESEVAGVVP
jgi:hypothetical protein